MVDIHWGDFDSTWRTRFILLERNLLFLLVLGFTGFSWGCSGAHWILLRRWFHTTQTPNWRCWTAEIHLTLSATTCYSQRLVWSDVRVISWEVLHYHSIRWWKVVAWGWMGEVHRVILEQPSLRLIILLIVTRQELVLLINDFSSMWVLIFLYRFLFVCLPQYGAGQIWAFITISLLLSALYISHIRLQFFILLVAVCICFL